MLFSSTKIRNGSAESNIFDKYKEAIIKALHDDTIIHTPIAYAIDLFKDMVTLLKELGLEINESKTAILHYEGENMEYIKKVAETIGLQADSNGNFDGITTAGLTFGGYPVGSDEYIQRFLIAKSKKFSERIDTIIKNSKCKDAGVLISITRKCIASSWSYLTRVIAPRHWIITNAESGKSIGDTIDDDIMRPILTALNINKYRKEGLSPDETS